MASLSMLMDEIDDWCGTGPHPFPHGPHWLRDVLTGVVISQLAPKVTNSEARTGLERISASLMKAPGARAAVSDAVGTETRAVSGARSGMARSGMSALFEDIDDWCGTPPHRPGPPPPPWLRDVLTGVVISQLATQVSAADARKELEGLGATLMKV